MMTAVFRRLSGELVDVDIPWGTLPSLQYGRIYQDGSATSKTVPLKRMALSFSENDQFDSKRAGDILPWSFYSLENHENLSEMCLKITTPKHIVIVPSLEVIRAFFGANRFLAEALLAPNGLADIVEAKLDNRKLYLSFNARTPYSVIRNKTVVGLIAKILFNDEWLESWKQVWHRRVESDKAGKTENSIPLVCDPPVLTGAVWNVLALVYGKVVFVQRVDSTESSTSIPYDSITFTHPNSRDTQRVNFGGRSNSAPNLNVDVANVIRKANVPTKLTQPVLVPIKGSDHIDPFKVVIKEIDSKPAYSPEVTVGQTLRKVVDMSVPLMDISFFEEAGKGSVHGGEFVPLAESGNMSVPDSMKLFFEAINHMQEQYRYACRSLVKDIPIQSSIAHTITGDARKYAIVEVSRGKDIVNILEIDSSDRHSMSTLIFSRDSFVHQTVAHELLIKHITSNGAWNKKTVNTLLQGRLLWGKHRGADVKLWGKRLGIKLTIILSRYRS